MSTAFIAFGSNLGDRLGFFRQVVSKLSKYGVVIQKTSPLKMTKPLGGKVQPDYLNAVLKVQTFDPPFCLLQKLQKIEASLGRKRSHHYASRTVDLDVLFYGRLRLQDRALTIPHPRFHERSFLIDLMREVQGTFEHPLLKKIFE